MGNTKRQQISCMKKDKNNLTFVIHPTEYRDYNILAIGASYLLEQLSHKEKHFHLIKSSKFGGIPLIVMDTCDTLRDAKDCIKQYKELYKNEVQNL